MDARIPVCDLKAQVASLRPELDRAVDRVLSSGWFVLGEEGKRFEAEFAAWLGVPHVVGVANGTDAIHLALRAAGVRAGDRVLIPPSTANPTAAAITAAGADPCFADVEEETGLFAPAALEEALERQRPSAVVPVHLYGRCEEMQTVTALAARHGVAVIEDAAQAHGAEYGGRRAGTIGLMGCFSFYPTKNLGAYGDGGAIATSDPALAQRLQELRNYGQTDRYHHAGFGLNSRLDELQAAVLRVKLPRLIAWNERRRTIAGIYRSGLAGLPLCLPPEDGLRSAHHLFVIRVARRENVRRSLEDLSVGTEIHYPVPVHAQGAYAHLGLAPGSFPHAERRARQIVTLPLYPEMSDAQVERVIDAVRQSLRGEPRPEETP